MLIIKIGTEKSKTTGTIGTVVGLSLPFNH